MEQISKFEIAVRKAANEMQYTNHYQSPLGEILLAGDETGLTGLWFVEHQRYFAQTLAREHEEKNLPVFETAKLWLDCYFTGKDPDFLPPLHFTGTYFQKEVQKILCTIPYGHTMTYGEIAAQMAKERGIARMSARAVGGAVGRNPISIIIPCHRVVGTNGNLTGYGGGIDRKVTLLKLEHIDTDRFFIPKTGTAL